MRKFLSFFILFLLTVANADAQDRKLAVIGSSTAAGLATSRPDSAWVNRINHYYKYQLGKLDSTYNLGVSGSNLYAAMPDNYTAPSSRPDRNPSANISRAVRLLGGLPAPSNGVVIVNFPSGGYETYSISEILSALQIIYDSAISKGNRCYITTTQPRTDGGFNNSIVKKKLADLKDSILNRFGQANTLNFWDDMFNPADTTILPAYSAGDNVHFNNAGHRELFNRVLAKNIFNLATAPVSGDYRSNISGTAAWNNAATWQMYNGSAWVPAGAAPSSASGTITIRSGQRIDITTATTLDQVVIESNASLFIYNLSTATNFTLNDGPGADIEVNGSLFISSNATLVGAGTIRNNYGGLLTIRNTGILAVNTQNLGTMVVNNTGTIQNATLTNDRTFTLSDFTLNLNNATFVNNDSVSLPFSGLSYIAGSTPGTFINNPAAKIFKPSGAGMTRFNANVAFSNQGSIKGFGELQIVNSSANTGTIAPGNSPGILMVNPALITGKAAELNIEIGATGATAGADYDQLMISTVDFASVNLNGSTLTVTDNAQDPVGTVYTIVSNPGGTITGNFAAVTLPPSLGNLTYSAKAVTVQKTSVLPLTWGRVNGYTVNDYAQIEWTTLQEINTNHFIVEYSANGVLFQDISMVSASGFSTDVMEYSFSDREPRENGSRFYRIRQVDRDGSYSYSTTIKLQMGTSADLFNVRPNPFTNTVTLSLMLDRQTIVIKDVTGRMVYNSVLSKGSQQVDLNYLPVGAYWLAVIHEEAIISQVKLLKQ